MLGLTLDSKVSLRTTARLSPGTCRTSNSCSTNASKPASSTLVSDSAELQTKQNAKHTVAKTYRNIGVKYEVKLKLEVDEIIGAGSSTREGSRRIRVTLIGDSTYNAFFVMREMPMLIYRCGGEESG